MPNFYDSVRSPDVASLTYNGLHYTCFVWVDRANHQIDAAIFVEQPQGESVLLLRNAVYTEAGVGTHPGPPKILVTGSIFLAFWVDGDRTTLRKAWLDVSNLHAVNAWTEVANPLTLKAEAAPYHALFDVHTCGDLGGSGDTPSANYVLVFKESVNGWQTLHKYTSHNTWTPAWANTTTGHIPVNCLAVYANATQGDVCTVYQSSGTTSLRFLRRNESDGGGVSTIANMFTSAPANGANWSAAGICYAGADLVAVVVEGQPTGGAPPPAWLGTMSRFVAYRAMKPSDASVVGNEFNTKNVSLQSRPWVYADEYTNGATGARTGAIHCVLGHKWYEAQDDHWHENAFFVADLHQDLWDTATSATTLATPCGNLNLGTADSRGHVIISIPTVGKHANHVSSAAIPPQYGPNTKTRTIAEVIYRRLTTEYGTLPGSFNAAVPVPATPSIRGYRHHHEAPWFPHHDIWPMADQTKNFDGLYTRAHMQTVQAGNGLFISGGTPAIYDGAQVAEVGYCWVPQLDVGGAVPGGVEEGVHYWTVVLEWRDAKGQIHRSKPAPPRRHDVDAGGEVVSIHATALNLTLKEGAHYPDSAAIDFVFYRTLVDGSAYYRVFDISATPTNDLNGWDVSASDNQKDSEIVFNEMLPYQMVGGQWAPMVNFQPPAFTCCARWQNRIWGVSAEDEREVWYSMEMFPEPGGVTYEIPRFNPANRYRVDECSGVTALQQMDGAMVVFARDRIFILRGLGNTDVGTGSSLEHQIVADGVGCVNPKSVVLGPPGVFFQSDRGYHLLTRTLELEYLSAGAAVEDTLRSTGNIRVAILLEDRHEIRLFGDSAVFDDQIALSYNYLFGLWHRHTLPQGHSTAKWSGTQDAVYWRGQDGEEAHAVLQTSTLHVERPTDANTYKDTGSGGDFPIGIILETDWIHLSGLDGFNRLRKVLVQCAKPQASEMTVILYLDYTGSYSAAGDDSASFTFTSPAEEVLVAVAKVQKCNAFRVRILESGTIPKTENVSVQGIRLEYAKKPGPMRLPDAYRVKPT